MEKDFLIIALLLITKFWQRVILNCMKKRLNFTTNIKILLIIQENS